MWYSGCVSLVRFDKVGVEKTADDNKLMGNYPAWKKINYPISFVYIFKHMDKLFTFQNIPCRAIVNKI